MPARVAKIADCGYKYIETWKGGDVAELKTMADAGNGDTHLGAGNKKKITTKNLGLGYKL